MRELKNILMVLFLWTIVVFWGTESYAVVPKADGGNPVLVEVQNRNNCFIVVSKKEQHLSVYEARINDTVLVARFDCCLGKNYGNKQKRGDMRTPESSLHNPFKITSIENSSWWTHDFGDGRGSVKSYGKWFLRLSYGFGIGIHGSTNCEATVPGRYSEGCIRLRDADIDLLKQNYAFVGMKVIIKGENEDAFGFEKFGS